VPRHAHRHHRPKRAEDGALWVWGRHAVRAALANPERSSPVRLLATAERAAELDSPFAQPEIIEAAALSRLLPAGAAHQGMALLGPPPPPTALSQLAAEGRSSLVMLDQVTDPANVGAVFRSAWALGAAGVVLQERRAPALASAVAKAAAGGIDKVAHARVVNLARALDELDAAGWRAVGLDANAEDTLDGILDDQPTVIVLGAEGEGLRRLVAEHCQARARIPMAAGAESLNIAAVAAIALYEAARARR